MTQYLVAQWDYIAEGNYELSFKEGDKIKLLEKHNDDWWEGELNDEIGFFPANRTTPYKEADTINKISLSSASSTATTPNINLDTRPHIIPVKPNTAISTNPYLNTKPSSEKNQDISLPEGWSYSYDQSGQIYYFNETTGESQWEKPQQVKTTDIDDLVYHMNKLNLEALHPNWIRLQNYIQMKVMKEDTILSWRDYYAVLTNRFILIYKEGLNKMGKRPSSIKFIPAFCTIDLKSASLTPATKADTRKKYAFIIDLPDQYKIFLNIPNEALYTEWLDAIMREMINANDNKEQQDHDLIDLLASISLPSKLDAPTETAEDDSKSTLTRWFSRSSRNNSIHKHHPQSTPLIVHEIIGGSLKLEADGNIPSIIRLCAEQVEKRGLDVVGIYRLSGQTTSIQKWKTQFNTKPEEVNLAEEPDINVITGLLKLYFRELKNPLLTFEYYDRLIEAARLQDYDERMFRLKSIIQVLPVANYKVLKYLARHLERVKNHSHINKMETTNLALIFSMSLLRSKNEDPSASILHNDLSSKVIEIIINNVDWFFDIDTDDDTSSSINNSSIVL